MLVMSYQSDVSRTVDIEMKFLHVLEWLAIHNYAHAKMILLPQDHTVEGLSSSSVQTATSS